MLKAAFLRYIPTDGYCSCYNRSLDLWNTCVRHVSCLCFLNMTACLARSIWQFIEETRVCCGVRPSQVGYLTYLLSPLYIPDRPRQSRLKTFNSYRTRLACLSVCLSLFGQPVVSAHPLTQGIHPLGSGSTCVHQNDPTRPDASLSAHNPLISYI